MAGLLGRAAAEVNEQTDDEISDADQVLIDDGRVAGDRRDDDAGLELDAAPLDPVVGLVPYADGRQGLRHVDRLLDGQGIDFSEDISGPYTGVIGPAVGGDAERLDHGNLLLTGSVGPGVIDPGDS